MNLKNKLASKFRVISAIVITAMLLSTSVGVASTYGSTSPNKRRKAISRGAQAENKVRAKLLMKKLDFINEELSDMAHSSDEAVIADYENMGLHQLRERIENSKLGYGIKKSLSAKISTAIQLNRMGGKAAVKGRENLTVHMENAVAGTLNAFVHEVNALKGKKIPEGTANELIKRAENLRDATDRYGLNLLPQTYQENALVFENRLHQRGTDKVTKARNTVDKIQDLGYDVRIKQVDNKLVLQAVHHSVTVVVAATALTTGAISAYLTWSEIEKVEKKRNTNISWQKELIISAADGVAGGLASYKLFAAYGADILTTSVGSALGLPAQSLTGLAVTGLHRGKAEVVTMAKKEGWITTAYNWIQGKVHEIFLGGRIIVKQGEKQFTVEPLSTGESIKDFYTYYDAESHTNTGIERSDVSELFLWKGPNGLSLVMIHDRRDDGSGGAVTFEFPVFPAGSWIVKDDPGDKYHQSKADWSWADRHTDGGAYNLKNGSDFNLIRIEPLFNEKASREPLTPGRIKEWQFLSGNAKDPKRITLNMEKKLVITPT